jgi:hypothetical protein
MSTHPRPALIGVYVMLYVSAMLVWAFNMIRWMLARCEVIDLAASKGTTRRR